MHTRGGERNAEAWWSAYTEGEGRVEGALTGCGNKSSANIVGARASKRNRWRGGALLRCVIFDVGSSRLSGPLSGLAGSSAPRKRGWRVAG